MVVALSGNWMLLIRNIFLFLKCRTPESLIFLILGQRDDCGRIIYALMISSVNALLVRPGLRLMVAFVRRATRVLMLCISNAVIVRWDEACFRLLMTDLLF